MAATQHKEMVLNVQHFVKFFLFHPVGFYQQKMSIKRSCSTAFMC